MKNIVLRIRIFAIRHKVSLADLGLLLSGFAVMLSVAAEFDIFSNGKAATLHQERIDLDEALMLGALLAAGFMVFAFRRFLEQKRETARRIAAERYARELAFQDALTGLPNRRQFDDALGRAILSPPAAGEFHGIFLLDLNGFKRVNDVYGHGAGDEVLNGVARRLQGVMREGDMVARFGGDEFAILALNLASSETATSIAYRVIAALKPPIEATGASHTLGTGIGVALFPSDAFTAVELVRKADIALYRAKQERRSTMRFFTPDMDRSIHDRARVEIALRQALDNKNIHPVFKPIHDLQTQEIIGFEAVPQWLDTDGEEIAPERFVAIAEDAGLIHELSDRLLHEAAATASEWPRHVWLSINIHPFQLKDSNLSWRILQALQETRFSPKRLQVEISEAALVGNMDTAPDIISKLRTEGVKVVLDKFGTGYSSLYHLRNVKIDSIKIDKGFIGAMTSEAESAAIVSALVGLGQGFGLTVAAEGIADLRQGVALLASGCNQGQGELFGLPLRAAETYSAFSRQARVRPA